MRLKPFTVITGALIAFSQLAATAAGWDRYVNARFAFAIDTPPGFSEIEDSDNGDGKIFTSEDVRAELRVWGSHLTEGDFNSEVGLRVQAEKSDGWAITYDHRANRAASWSGIRSGREAYARAMKGCDEAAVYFRLEYARADLDGYHDIVGRLVKSLRTTC